MIGKSRKYCAPRRLSYPLWLMDLLVDIYAQFFYKRRARPKVDSPRFLILMSGHLGDALTMSYLFPLIQKTYPECSIDVVVGDWCDPILVHNPCIRRIIHLNHATTNRRNISKTAKWRDHIRTTRAAIKTLKNETYSAFIDLRFSDSPFLFLLPFLQVQKAVGFGTRGLGGLLDEEFFLPDREFHHLELLLDVLGAVGVKATLADINPYFNFPEKASQTLVQKLPFLNQAQPYILLCPESGAASRFLPNDFWIELAGKVLHQQQGLLIGCGQQNQTKELLQQIKMAYPTYQERVYDAVAQLNLNELAALSQKAAIAFTLESLPAHLCSIYCPTVSFFYNGTGLQFFPLSNFPILIFHNHVFSKNLTIERPGFLSQYVEAFDEDVIARAMDWVQTLDLSHQ